MLDFESEIIYLQFSHPKFSLFFINFFILSFLVIRVTVAICLYARQSTQIWIDIFIFYLII